MRNALADALQRQRGPLKRLLTEAGVRVEDAEELVLGALTEKAAEEWENVKDVDAALLACVERACAKYARRRAKKKRRRGF